MATICLRVGFADVYDAGFRPRTTEQLMIYALALSKHTDLRLFDFKCAWFDDEYYYEFYPLHVVHKRKRMA